ncbi:MAG: rod shape-determining protein RodA [Pseudomonadota bacterium]|nr:rod shape-determining protein RodA [Pseudomonadota bacterium]MDE3038600.1 rod shape-determining protein RodA [Pseudomonadota bacterium]
MSIRPDYRQSPLASLAEINWLIVGLMTIIACIGFVMMVSAAGGSFLPWAVPQMMRFALAFVLMIIIALLPMRLLMDYAYPVYIACLLVLLGVDILGHIGMGARRWLSLGGLNIQPSEFMKLAVILALARYFHQTYPEDIRRIPFLIPPAMMIALPAVLILKEPNLGTTLILVTTGGVICFFAGVRWRYFIGLALAALAAAPVVWHLLHDYQKRRVLTFLNPDSDPLGAGYNILQSMIAIGSGGFFGKGFLQGSQSQLDFLPEKHTDFIFTVLAEEFGFFGCLVLLGLYVMLLASGMMVAGRSRSTFGSLMAAGVVALIFLHILINCGMVMDLLPVVGVPLPLMSYGGSIMLSTVLAVGLLQNAWVHRDELPLRLTPKL